jgi:hypothetical protein
MCGVSRLGCTPPSDSGGWISRMEATKPARPTDATHLRRVPRKSGRGIPNTIRTTATPRAREGAEMSHPFIREIRFRPGGLRSPRLKSLERSARRLEGIEAREAATSPYGQEISLAVY